MTATNMCYNFVGFMYRPPPPPPPCPDSIASMLRSRYPVFSLPAMHSLEANDGRSEETEEKVEGDRYEEGDEIVNFLWVAVRTVVVVEDGRPGAVTSVDGPDLLKV